MLCEYFALLGNGSEVKACVIFFQLFLKTEKNVPLFSVDHIFIHFEFFAYHDRIYYITNE